MSSHLTQGKGLLSERKSIHLDPIQWALQKNNHDWYRDLVEHSRDLLCIHDLQGNLHSVNPLPARVLGYSVEELLQIPMREMIAPEFRSQFDLYLKQIEHEGEAHGLMMVVGRSGERRIWEYHNSLRTTGEGPPIVLGLAHDVTQQRQAEALLKTGERKFRALHHLSPIGVAVVDPQTGRFLEVNPKFCEIMGRTERDLLARNLQSITHPDDIAANLAQIARITGSEAQHIALEKRYLRPDGSVRLTAVELVRLWAEGASPVVTMVQDITERKRAEESLRKSEERLRLAQQVAKIGTFEQNLQTGESRWTPETETMYGLEPGGAPQSLESFLQLVHPEDRPHVEHLIAESMEAGETEGEWRVIWPDSTVHWIAGKWRIFKDEHGKPLRAIGMDFDITERKRAEEALRGSEAELREAQRVAHTGSWRLDLKTQGVTWSEQIYRELGLNPSSLPPTFRELTQLLTPEGFQRVVQAVERVRYSRQPEEIEVGFHRADGSTGWALLRGEIDCDGTGTVIGLHGIALDITSRKQAEERLREYEKALEGLEEMIVVVDREYRYVIANRAYLKYRQMEEEELVGKLLSEVLTKGVFETIVKPKLDEGFQGKVVKYEMRDTYPQLGERDMLVTYLPIERQTGIDRVVCVLQDITERKQAETSLREVVEELRLAKEKLAEERVYLEEEIDTELGFGDIIGKSAALRAIMSLANKVATSDATVLITGETGTGKELVARAIHRMSTRRGSSFIKMNCAAIPTGLLESELFGYEKGAFTGAVGRKLGRLELADKGTLFLDEIGEIPLPLQPKLLRVLQDQEFERLGGTQTLKVDFRLVAATNRDLLESVRKNEFRSDLYYRLHVFPVRVPPLRERRDDIRPLVKHFVQKCAKRMNKRITSIPERIMDVLEQWDWPGNVRELENFVERSVILTHGSVLVAPLGELRPASEVARDETLEAAERQHILRALRESNWKIGGPRGAAARLGLKRTTLQSKLKQMRIDRLPPAAGH